MQSGLGPEYLILVLVVLKYLIWISALVQSYSYSDYWNDKHSYSWSASKYSVLPQVLAEYF